jgi:hypothetical protein
MNQERFDELAKGLATRFLSRRQVLKGIGAAVSGAALTSIPRLAWADISHRATDCQGSGLVAGWILRDMATQGGDNRRIIQMRSVAQRNSVAMRSQNNKKGDTCKHEH